VKGPRTKSGGGGRGTESSRVVATRQWPGIMGDAAMYSHHWTPQVSRIKTPEQRVTVSSLPVSTVNPTVCLSFTVPRPF
jgi:hypothetical protein